MSENNLCDVIIAGAGPAGSTAATLLAQYGHRVLMLDKDSHPRFHIGESMLPMAEPIMKRLNLDWSCGNLHKGGAEFIDEKSGKRTYFPFQGKYRTFQVERSVFDQRLFENAVEHGVTAHQQEKVIHTDCNRERVTVQTDKGDYTARYFIDATGRNAIMGRKRQSINKLDKLGKFSLYRHYRLADNAITRKLFETGNIEILLTEPGWFWCIPLTEGRLSLGLVVQKDMEDGLKGAELFDHYAAKSPRLTELLEGAELQADIRAEADFSYFNRQRYGIRYACCGDAAGFLDPVFSSGFFFAVKTAEMVADTLHLGLTEGREAEADLHKGADEIYQTGFQTMYLMIERFYRSNLVHNLFFESERAPRIKEDIIAILAGDLWTGDNQFQKGLLTGRNNLPMF